MEEITEYRQELLSKTAGVADELSAIVAKIQVNAWHVSGSPYAPPPHYILAYLAEFEAPSFTDQLRRIYDGNSPILPLVSDDGWMANHYNPEKPVQELLEIFSRSLQQEVEWLRGLPSEVWSRSARHPWWGVRTLQWWVERQLSISEQHIKALTAFIGA